MRTSPRYNASETAMATEHAQCGAVTSHLLLLLLQLVSYCRRQVITCTSLRSQADSLQAVAAACDSHRTADSLGTGSAALYSRSSADPATIHQSPSVWTYIMLSTVHTSPVRNVTVSPLKSARNQRRIYDSRKRRVSTPLSKIKFKRHDSHMSVP